MSTKTATEARDRIAVRVPLHLREMVAQAAEASGATINQFVVQAALEAAERVLEREQRVTLSLVEAKRFCALLDNPPAPNAALRGAFERYRTRKE